MSEPSMNPAQEDAFRTDHLDGDLKTRAVRGAAVMVMAQGVNLVISTAGTMVLARLVVPEHFGLVAKVTAVTNFVLMLRDMGLTPAMVQKRDLTHEETSTLFWVNASLSVLAGLIVAALAPAVAWFYGEPKLAAVTYLIAGTIFAGGLGIQHAALLRRQMRFLVLSATQQTAMALGFATGIVLACFGAGYWSLVIMQAVTAAAHTTGMWIVTKWRPGRPRLSSGVKQLLAFGGHMTAYNIPSFFSLNLDQILIGRSWGDAALGFYSKAQSILYLPLRQISGPVNAVAMPTLSRLQGQEERFRAYYVTALSLVAFLIVPVSAACLVFSEEAVAVFLGPKWVEAGAIYRLLGIAAVAMPLSSTMAWLFVSRGRSFELLKYGTIGVVLTVLSYIIGVRWGAEGVALGGSIAAILWTPVGMWFAVRGTGVTLADAFGSLVQPLAASAAGAAAALALKLLAASALGPLATLVLGCALFAAIYLAIVLYVFRRKEFFLSVWRALNYS